MWIRSTSYLAIAVTCKVLHKCVVHPKMISDSDWRAINDMDEDNNCIIMKRVVCTERNGEWGSWSEDKRGKEDAIEG